MTLLASSGGRAVCREGISALFTPTDNLKKLLIQIRSNYQRIKNKKLNKHGSNQKKQHIHPMVDQRKDERSFYG